MSVSDLRLLERSFDESSEAAVGTGDFAAKTAVQRRPGNAQPWPDVRRVVSDAMALILAGGRGLGLKHGRHVDYNAVGRPEGYRYELDTPGRHYAICHRPVNPQARLANLLLTMAQKMDVRTERFADSTGIVSEVLA